MQAMKWEYKTIKLDVSGWFLPDVDPSAFDAELNVLGDAGWELVTAFDVNRLRGATSEVVALLKRPRN